MKVAFGAYLLFHYGGKKQQFHNLSFWKQRHAFPEIVILQRQVGRCCYTVNLPILPGLKKNPED